MAKNPNFDFDHLSPSERVQLAQDLWDSVEPEDTVLPLTEAQRAELRRRVEAYDRDPDAVKPWDEVRDELMRDLGFGNASAA